jgi:phage tail sheath protein FI
MPVNPTYPGVYIEEIPSGVRTITGVATSITAFIGRAIKGPVDEPVTINNYGDFERTFGGLWRESTLGYAVRDFYTNGGSQAIVVRLYCQKGQEKAKPILDVNGLTLEAASPGTWGNDLRARVDHTVASEVAERFGLQAGDMFNLTVRDTKTGATESFLNVSVKDSPRRVDRVLKESSNLVAFSGTLPSSRPDKHADPQSKLDIWADNNPATSSKVVDTGKASDGDWLQEKDFTGDGKEGNKQGLYALEKADLFNLLCIPPYNDKGNVDASLVGSAATYCEKRRAMLLVDSPTDWNSVAKAREGLTNLGTNSKNVAVFFPRLIKPDPLRENQLGEFVPCGAVAGIFARTDAQRGVWKAPAGLEATLNGVPALSVSLTDPENGQLNPLGINCLRTFPATGRIVWGARTLQGNDQLASEWKYIPVRRLALFLEESLYRGTQWVVFEPNDEPLWSQIRLNLGAFMQNLFKQGAFQGKTPKEAYFVKCDSETTTQNDINLGIVNIVIGFAPLKPAEFVIIKFQQIAGQIAT